MAWIFSLSAECGPSRDAADAIARHFHAWPTTVFQEPGDQGNWWCAVTPEGVGRHGAESPEEAARMTALAEMLYDRLKSAPPCYRFALAGVEVDMFRTYGELLAERDVSLLPGLVVDEAIAVQLSRALAEPALFVPFSSGYRWLPYRS
ncbi:MAG TPA: hypothetical protein VH877_02890 [Polyangia bacterium]|nr:hypothetical protein [Polyangia bacterium]